MNQVRWLISGRVQGVGYRAFIAREAGRLGLVGTVRNLADGRVEVVAAGSAGQLEALRDLAAKGPRMAAVSSVDNTEILVDVTKHKRFDII